MSGAYDYVIVGAGSAGCVLANRLSADPSTRVCLVEAGPRDTNPWIHLPVGIPQVIADATIDWSFWTTPQPGLNDRRIFMPRGKTLGGSSAINAMVAVRGHPLDYDDWAKAGATGWAFEDVLPYFCKAESFEGADALTDGARYHGSDGPLTLSKPRYVNPLVTAFVAAAVAAGVTPNEDFNGGTSDGVGLFHVFEKAGRRFSNADAYLHPVEHRPNLDLLTGAQVEKVQIEGGRAVGVDVVEHGTRRSIIANCEVILCAGAIGSPQLLMLSGVGPGGHLHSLGIPVVHDAPEVGANLQDHLDIHISTLEKGHLAISERPEAWARLAVSFGRYVIFRDGEISTNVSQAGAFLRTLDSLDRPDVQLHFTPILASADGLDPSLVRDHFGYTIACCGLAPGSRGSVRLASADPAVAPLIDPNYLGHPDDVFPILRGIRLAREILAQPAIARFGDREFEPGAPVTSEESLADYLRRRGATTYHPVGTCRMGSDAGAPLTPELRVRGVSGLRVIDASVMPRIIGGNTNGATTMIAEKGAALVLGKSVVASGRDRSTSVPAGQTDNQWSTA